MLSLLIISEDSDFVAEIEKIGDKVELRARSVSTRESASQWLAMRSVDVLLIDSRCIRSRLIPLFSEGWKLNPLMNCCVFNPIERVEEEWDARLAGAKVFWGANVIEEIQTFLERLAEDSPKADEFSILLVEDLDSPRDIICSYIEAMGYSQLTGVSGAREAMQVLENKVGAYSCIITDINMPEVRGTELIKQIRASKDFSHLPIVVLTAYGTAENLIDCIKAGATGFLVKPPRKKSLREELEKAKRIFVNRQDPRLSSPEDAHLLESALSRKGLV